MRPPPSLSLLFSYTQYASVPADKVLALPDGVSFKQASAILLQGMTAHYLVNDSYAIQKGDTVLVHAAAGGTGERTRRHDFQNNTNAIPLSPPSLPM